LKKNVDEKFGIKKEKEIQVITKEPKTKQYG